MNLFLKYPERDFTVNELSKLSKTSYATTWRFIQELDRAGLIHTTLVGHSLACKLNQSSSFLREIKKVFEIEFSPHRLVSKEFVDKVKRVSGVKRVILFGSVARGTERLTSDIDIAVIIDKKEKNLESKVTSVADDILKKSKMTIVPFLVTTREILEDRQFGDQLKRGEVLYERVKRSRILA